MSTNERLTALKYLIQVVDKQQSLAQCLPSSASPMIKELCFGVCRHYVRLSVIADALTKKRPKSIEVWLVILLGLYQLHYMKLPDYAVVKETVGLLDKVKKTWGKALANAILRTFCRESAELIAAASTNDAFLYGHPQPLLEQIQQAWPDDWRAIIAANDRHPPMTLRVNLSQIARADYLAALENEGMRASAHPLVASAITLEVPCDVRSLPGFAQGWVSVQDAAAQCAVSLLQLQPGLNLLDACCAPGGKTVHILETQPDLALCLALDIEDRRLNRVRDNLERMQVHATVMQGDALQPKQWANNQVFERILLDAPCSATGVIRRHADIKLLRTKEDIAAVARTQYKLLRSLWPLLAPQGLLVYATCSIMPEENEEQIARFVAQQADCRVLAIDSEWGRATGHGRQILPGEHGMDGFFYSVLQKDDNAH